MSCVCAQLNIKAELSQNRKFATSSRRLWVFARGTSSFSPDCSLCQIVRECFEKTSRSSIELSVVTEGRTKDLHGVKSWVLGLHIHVPTPWMEDYLWYLIPAWGRNYYTYAQLIPVNTSAHLLGKQPEGHATRLDSYYTSRECIKSWLQKCESDHTGCRLPSHNTRNRYKGPRRLVNVKTMCIQQAPYSTDRYFCLSYVWGNIQRKVIPYQTIEDTFRPGYLSRVKNCLHTVVRNAIQLTQELDETYLWIDSLCIDQDDNAQKLKDMNEMDEIFNGATMTIVALDSVDADDGLHGVAAYSTPRTQSIVDIDGIEMLRAEKYNPLGSYPRESLYMERRIGKRIFTQAKPSKAARNILGKVFPDRDDEDSMYPWHTRKWTMQEAMFSRRRLLLTSDQAYFSCQSGSEAEYKLDNLGQLKDDARFNLMAFSYFSPEAMGRTEGRTGFLKAYHKLTDLYSSIPKPYRKVRGFYSRAARMSGNDAKELESTWWKTSRQIIEEFSGRISGFPEDRYLAFYGIENGQVTTWNIDSVAGLPVNILPLTLFWRHTYDHCHGDFRRVPQYPSWSWIGWDGTVSYKELENLRDVDFRLHIQKIGAYASESVMLFDLKFDIGGLLINAVKDEHIEERTPLADLRSRLQRTRNNRYRSSSPGSSVDIPSLSLFFQAESFIGNMYAPETVGRNVNLVNKLGIYGNVEISRVDARCHRDGTVMFTLLGTSMREEARCYRTQYRPRGKQHGRKGVWSVVVILLGLAPCIIVSYYVSRAITEAFAKDSKEQYPEENGQLVRDLPGAIGGVCGFVLCLLLWRFIVFPIVELMFSARLAHIILLRPTGDGRYERVGIGEMSYQEFKKEKPKKRFFQVI